MTYRVRLREVNGSVLTFDFPSEEEALRFRKDQMESETPPRWSEVYPVKPNSREGKKDNLK